MSRSSATLSLFPGEPGCAPRPSVLQGRQPQPAQERRLWLALHLLDSASASSSARASASTSASTSASPAAQAAGRTLGSLAICARRLTPVVSLEPPDGLLLEIGGSLRLFGGIDRIREVLAGQLQKRGLSYRLGIAPTAKAALWLSRHPDQTVRSAIRSAIPSDTPLHDEAPQEEELSCSSMLGSRLRALPLSVTRWPDKSLALLAGMGITSIGDCLRLPREGLARRIGRQCLADLDKALGKAADPRLGHTAPRVFARKVDLTCESADTRVLADAAETVFAQMERELRSLQQQVLVFRLVLHHLRREPTVERFELIEASHEAQRCLELVTGRLERMALPAPVIAVGIQTQALKPMQLGNDRLFAAAESAEEATAPTAEFLERLRERFGPRGVCRLGLVADHRPESAWEGLSGLHASAASDHFSVLAGARPLWLLDAPSPLSCAQGRPVYGGRLAMEEGPERIEGGWWSGQDVRRDYYTASTQDGRKVWVYKDRASGAWYLHGFFG